jgi:hypothetical protein
MALETKNGAIHTHYHVAHESVIVVEYSFDLIKMVGM